MKRMLGLMPGMGDLTRMMGDSDAEGDARRLVGIINSMTLAERRNPRLVDPSRRNRIAQGSGTQTQEVTQLIKQFEFVAPMMKAMAGKGISGRMQALQELQRSGMLDPSNAGGYLPRIKKGTGKRLSTDEKARMRKQREKEMRRRRRGV